MIDDKLGYYFYSKQQETMMMNIEGKKYKAKYVIVNGKKIPFTEKCFVNISTYSDARLMITAYDIDANVIM